MNVLNGRVVRRGRMVKWVLQVFRIMALINGELPPLNLHIFMPCVFGKGILIVIGIVLIMVGSYVRLSKIGKICKYVTSNMVWGLSGPISELTGELVCGPETLSDDELAANRVPMWQELLRPRIGRRILCGAQECLQ
jgi:hypothetical protein